MQTETKKKRWLDKLLSLMADSPKKKSDLLEVLSESVKDGLIDSNSLEMIEGVFKVSEIQVREIMIPRPHMSVIDVNDDINEVIKKVVDSGHSRFPVIDQNRDNIIGILFAKDLLKRANTEKITDFDLHDCLRPAIFVPESKRLNILLNEFKSGRNHIAIVIGEHSNVSGLVTIEDVLEEIVGEIDDEHDKTSETKILSQGKGKYLVDALTNLDEFNNYFSTSFNDKDVETLGGYLINKFERVPSKNEIIKIDNLIFKIIAVDSRKINRVQVVVE